MRKKIVVVGAGIGGLATACLLAKDGYQIIVLEKNSLIGGRARYLKLKDFYFDKGPSWYMMPEVFENFFKIFNSKTADFYRLKKLDVHYRVFFDDGKTIDIYSNLNKNLKTFKKLDENGDIKLKKLLKKAKYIYEESMKQLVFESYKNHLKLAKPEIIKNLIQFNLFQTLHDYIKNIFKNEKLQKILEYTAVFLGGSPYNTPALYQLVTHVDLNLGIYYPIGGIYKIIEALKTLIKKYKLRIITKQEVKKVKIKNGLIKKVYTKNKAYDGDIFIINADYPFFETKILPKDSQTYPKKYWQNKVFSPSAFLIYLGINDPLPKSKHHNLYFTNQWEKHFKQVYQNKKIPEDPSFYYHIPSKTDSSMAPENCHSVMILVPTAPGLYFTKKTEKEFYNMIINKFANLNNIKNIEKKIIVKKIFHAKNFLKDYNSTQGAAFGLAHTLFQTAIFRPKNFSKKIKNLFYVGQYTNPGVGMPSVLISSQIVYKLVKEYERKYLSKPN